MRRPQEVMKDFKKILATATMFVLLSVNALAFDQKRDEQKPPPPKEPRVVEKTPKNEQPPPRNDGGNKGNREENRGDKKGKP
jgi:hypothetical protein